MVMAMMAATAATATTVTRAMAATAAVAGQCLVGTADQGNSNDREKDRDPENQCAIHPRILQLTGTLA